MMAESLSALMRAFSTVKVKKDNTGLLSEDL